MKLNKYEISHIIGSLITPEFETISDIEISDLENEGMNIELLSENNLTIHDYEGNHDEFKDFKMRIIKKLYNQFLEEIKEEDKNDHI